MVLQRVAACCSVLQRAVLQCATAFISQDPKWVVLQRVAACCSALERVAVKIQHPLSRFGVAL